MEQLLVLLVLILIPLANFLLERMRRGHERPPEARQRPVDMGMRRQAPPLPASAAARQARAARDAPPPATVERRLRRRRARAPLFRSKRELRRAIIAMTLLGPCRANDPGD